YRGHDYTGSASVMIAGSRCGLTPILRRELTRRSAIEPTIGPMKTDVTEGRLDRNFLLGHDGDTINALLVGVGHNLRLILAKLALWRACIRAALNVLMAKSDTSPDLPT
ncbi:IS5/IS1182 family transposase, partial [Rhizobium ruizarguesonis]